MNRIKLENIDNIYVTSDHHFSHKKICEYCSRPFNSTEEMNESLIKSWNEIVPEEGIIFHLGDISFKPNELITLLYRLNGKIYFLSGNHDLDIKNVSSLIDKNKFELLDDVVQLKVGGFEFILCHYPLMSWPGIGREVLHLHGHTHNTLKYHKLAKDIGVDTNNYKPYKLKEVFNEQ